MLSENCTFYKLENLVLFTQPEQNSKEGDAFLYQAKLKCRIVKKQWGWRKNKCWMKNPVLFTQPKPISKEGDAFWCQAKLKCKDAENRLYINPMTMVCQLAPQFSPNHAYSVIKWYGLSSYSCDFMLQLLYFSASLQFTNATKKLK